MNSEKLNVSAKSKIGEIVDNYVRNKEIYKDDEVIKAFSMIIGAHSSYREPKSIGKVPEKIYNVIKDALDEENETYINLVQNLIHGTPNENRIDIAVTVVKITEMRRHDYLIKYLSESLESAGIRVLDTEFNMSDHYNIQNKLTPDLLVSMNDVEYVIEVKMRDPSHLDMDFFYKKYKIEDLNLVLVVNFSRGLLYFHGDNKDYFQDRIRLTQEQSEHLESMIRETINIRNNYAKYELFNQLMNNELFEVESDMISGFRDACQDLEPFKEIKSLYGDYYADIEEAISNFNLTNQSCLDIVEGAEDKLQQYIITNLLDDIKSEYISLKENNDYSHFPDININIRDLIDNENIIKYDITSKYSPSLYVPFVHVKQINTSRITLYNQLFENLTIKNTDDYSLSAFNMIKNILTNDKLGVLLGHERVADESIEISNSATHTVPNPFVKSKLLTKESMQSYDLNIYVNNTFSYTDKNIADSKSKICGFNRKKYNLGTDFKKSSLLLSEKVDDIKFVENYLKGFSAYYTSESILEDMRTYHSSFNDFTDLDVDLIDEVAYYSYYTSNLYSSMIAVSQINNKKFRLIQCYDPNTICIMLPNGDIKDNKPIRFFTIVITEDEDDIILNKIMGNYHSHEVSGKKFIILSKVLTLDINRMKLLANSFVKYTILTSYYKTFIGYDTKRILTNFNSLLYTNMVTLQTLDVTENFKNIIMVCYSDYGNPIKLIKDKFLPRLKNYTCMQLCDKMINAIGLSHSQRNMIIKNQNKAEISTDGREILHTGFRGVDDMKLPISGLLTNNPREILQEAYIVFYLGNKTLHGSPQELISLYHVPYLFETEYSNYLSENKTVIQEITGDYKYGFSYESMKLTTICAYSNQMSDKKKIRAMIAKDLDLDSPLLSKPQFSSTKSMVTNDMKIDAPVLNEHSTFIDFKNWLQHTKFDDVDKFVSSSNVMIRVLNSKRGVSNEIAQEIFGMASEIDRSPFPFLKKEILPNGKYYITAKPTNYCRYSLTDTKDSENNKVFDEMLQLTKDDSSLSVRNALVSLLDNDNENNFRVFNKDQRTYNDREIYTGNKEARLCLYAIEKLFLSHNKLLPEEAITISGDMKHKRMYDQRCSIMKEGRYQSAYGRTLMSVSSDASKWSARDSYIKFLICIAYNPYLSPEEKWFYIYCFSRYYYKNIVLTEKVLHSIYELSNKDRNGRFEEMTDNMEKNYFRVRSNWLQGNLNRLSSFVHYCSSFMVKKTLDVLNSKYGDLNLMRFMVHSDDSTYDFSMSIKKENKRDLSMRTDFGRYIISIIKVCERRHSIILNEKKTYISTFYKEFLSTLIIGNVLSYFYLADLIPIASDLSYNSPLEDTASLSSFIQNAYAHSAPYGIIKTAINLINYTSLKTYNLNNTSNKSPINHFFTKSIYKENYSMVPISILPIYRFDVKLAGIIPYHCADAYYILKNILEIVGVDDGKTIEDQITKETLTNYISKADKTVLNYIKACMFSYDSTMFKIDDEDPYNTKDLAINTIVSLSKPRSGKRKDPKYKSYQEFKHRRTEILKKSTAHPEWLLTRPRDMDDSRDSILANYLKPTFIESLSFSTPAMEYGSRVIHSNREMYRLNIKGYTSEKLYNIKDIYNEIVNLSHNIDLDPVKLYSYLFTFLFSDKEISYAIQTIMTKTLKSTQQKVHMSLKITTPASIFRRDKGALSVTSILNEIFTYTGHLSSVDSKYRSIIDYSKNLLTSFNLDGVKLYRSYLDIDDNYLEYASFMKTKTDFDDVISILDITDDEEVRLAVHEIRVIYKSILIRYFSDMILADTDKDFKFDNYPTPQSILSTISKYSTKDVTTSKVYMAEKRSSRKDDYWLSRLGYYQDENMYYKYILSNKYNLDHSDQMIIRESNYEDINTFTSLMNFIIKGEMMDNYDKLKYNGMSYDDFLRKLHNSGSLNHKILLNKLGYMDQRSLSRYINMDQRIKNYWLISHGQSREDPNLSHVVYMFRTTFLSVQTATERGKILFKIELFHQEAYPDDDAVFRLITKLSKDNRSTIMNNSVYSIKQGLNIYMDSQKNLTTRIKDTFGRMNSSTLTYVPIRYNDIRLTDIKLTDENRHIYHIDIYSPLGNRYLGFEFKDNFSYNSESLLHICLENLEKHQILSNIIIDNRLYNEDNMFSIIKRLTKDNLMAFVLRIKNVGRPKISNKLVKNIKTAKNRMYMKSFLVKYEPEILETLYERYSRYGSMFYNFYMMLLEDSDQLDIVDHNVIDIMNSVQLDRSSSSKISMGNTKPFDSVFYSYLVTSINPDDIISIIESILMYIIKSAVFGTDFYIDLVDNFPDSDSDNDDDDDFSYGD
ncbi:RNA-dependent RNA polymerase [Karaka Okahu purepure emaravirus]|uniref:RNA-directed RNA polymerase L n=1 Tax=Karaka Okahu purepure emaravirus TaxID=2872811 RepID=A0AAX1PBC8_9VIRU|nr:RNA-dependent RNA polymerase [Karaka Okahu purepure emaravirus]QZN83753.1 RNA-dependent RNA polymerase [Karaka Okahu purepure emaravirus]